MSMTVKGVELGFYVAVHQSMGRMAEILSDPDSYRGRRLITLGEAEMQFGINVPVGFWVNMDDARGERVYLRNVLQLHEELARQGRYDRIREFRKHLIRQG